MGWEQDGMFWEKALMVTWAGIMVRCEQERVFRLDPDAIAQLMSSSDGSLLYPDISPLISIIF